MARRRTNPEISLFPFLSVLCTVIGVLLLFIVMVLSTRVIAIEELYAKTEDYERQSAPGEPDVLENGIDTPSYEELNAEVERLAKLLELRLEQRDTLSRKVDALVDLIEFTKIGLIPDRFPRPVPFDTPIEVAIVPDPGHKVEQRPIFMEVTSDSYIVQPSKVKFDAIKKPSSAGEPVASPELAKYLKGLNPRKEYLVFLLHPNGVSSFDSLLQYVRIKHENLRVGWEPFPRNWAFANEEEKLGKPNDAP